MIRLFAHGDLKARRKTTLIPSVRDECHIPRPLRRVESDASFACEGCKVRNMFQLRVGTIMGVE